MHPLTVSCFPADVRSPVEEITIGEALRRAAAARPDHCALVAGVHDPAARRRWNTAQLLSDAERVARALLANYRPGEHVAVWAPNIPEWVLLQYGAALAGLVLVTVNPAYQYDELAYVLEQSRAIGLFHAREYRGNPMSAHVAAVRPGIATLRECVCFDDWEDFLQRGDEPRSLPPVSPGEPAQIQYTSGTTGFPKGALLHHRGLLNNARLVVERWGVCEGETFVTPFPLFHCSGCGLSVLGALQTGCTLVLVHQFDPALVLELVETFGAEVLAGVPTMLIALLEHPDFARRNLSAVRLLLAGGAVVPPELVQRLEESLGASFSIVFGQTEASPVITQTFTTDSPEDKGLTIGPPLPNTEVKIIDPRTGEVVPIGVAGELCTRGYLVMNGYYDMPQNTAEAIDAGGWLHTGDLCSMDARGYCKVEGRIKDMIIRGGENIYPREIEDLLFRHPAVAEAAVIGVPDAVFGEQVAAFLRFGQGQRASVAELKAFAREHLAAYKTPSCWIELDSFPLTGSGKIRKFVLREWWREGRVGPNLEQC